MPVDPESLAALGDLAAHLDRDDPHASSMPLHDDDELTVALVRPSSGGPRDPLALLRSVDPATRQRVLALGAGSVLAGLVCGLLVPATADAASAPDRTVAPHHVALSLASASPFHALSGAAAARSALPATGRAATARAAALPRAHAAVLTAAEVGRSAAPAVTARTWHVTRPLPAASGHGRRIVYAEHGAHLWIVAADGTVLRDYKVTGRKDRPRPGTYTVYSKSEHTSNPKEKLTFDLMVRFAGGYTGAPIGFHTIPRTYSGHPIQSESQLGKAVGAGGCVRQSRVDAKWLYSWVRVGDTVVVLR